MVAKEKFHRHMPKHIRSKGVRLPDPFVPKVRDGLLQTFALSRREAGGRGDLIEKGGVLAIAR